MNVGDVYRAMAELIVAGHGDVEVMIPFRADIQQRLVTVTRAVPLVFSTELQGRPVSMDTYIVLEA